MSHDTHDTRSSTSANMTMIYIHKRRVLYLALLMLILLLVGVWLMLGGSATFVTGLIAVLIFGLTLLALVFLLIRPAVLLVIDEEGMHKYDRRRQARTIRWAEIACIRIATARFASSLSVDLTPEGRQSYLTRNFGTGKAPVRLTRDQLPTAFGVMLTLSNLPGKQARAFLQEHYAEQIQRYKIVL